MGLSWVTAQFFDEDYTNKHNPYNLPYDLPENDISNRIRYGDKIGQTGNQRSRFSDIQKTLNGV